MVASAILPGIANTNFIELKQIHHYILTSITIQFVHVFVLSQIDYYNSILLSLLDIQLNGSQSVLNVSAHLTLGCRWNDYVTTSLPRNKLHWPWIPECNIFKWCLFYRTLNDTFCLDYISSLVSRTTSNDCHAVEQLLVSPPAKMGQVQR